MSQAARSLFVFGIYLFLLGAVLVVAPNLLLPLFQMPETSEVWIRVVGMLVFIVGYYYVAAKNELVPVFLERQCTADSPCSHSLCRLSSWGSHLRCSFCLVWSTRWPRPGRPWRCDLRAPGGIDTRSRRDEH